MPYFSILFLFMLFSCQKETAPVHNYPAPNIVWEGKNGLFNIVKKGNGDTIQAGDRIKVHFTAWYTDGHSFDSSIKRNRPYPFVFGKGRVIKGWDTFLSKINKGGMMYLKLPPELAFGDGKADGVRPYAEVVFGIEILP